MPDAKKERRSVCVALYTKNKALLFLSNQPVGRRIGEDDPRPELLGILEIHRRIRRDDDHVADLHLAGGGVVIIASYALMDFEDAKQFRPWIVFPDTATNRLIG